MSKLHYMDCKSLHSLTKFVSKVQRIQVENGQFVSVLFIISMIQDIYGHRFEIYTLVSEINENIDLVLGIKNIFQLESVMNSTDCCFKFLNISLPIFPKEHTILKQKEWKLIKVNAPFIDEISGLVIIKILGGTTQSMILLKLKFMCNSATLDIAINDLCTIIFKPEDMLGILDLRSLGYYKIK